MRWRYASSVAREMSYGHVPRCVLYGHAVLFRQVAGALLEKLKAWNGAFGDDGKADAVDAGRPDMYM